MPTVSEEQEGGLRNFRQQRIEEQTQPAVVRYGIYLYFSSTSFRLAANCLQSIAKGEPCFCLEMGSEVLVMDSLGAQSEHLLNDASIEGKDDFCLLPVLKAIKD
jgi:hypothetical protein